MKILLLHIFLIPALLASVFKPADNPDKAILKTDKTAVNKPAEEKPFRIAVISDLNSSYGSTTYSADVTAVIKELAVTKPDMVLTAGDMVAGQKASLTEDNIRNMWDAFKQTVLAPVSRLNIPFGFTVGNHDASPSYHLDRRLAAVFWKENAALTHLNFADSAHFPFYYSYIKDNIFFISWDAAGPNVSLEVFAWMKAQLQGKAARKAKLRILLGHLPLYAIVDSKNKPGEVIANADSALAFFKQNGIDLYISGHQHAYFPAMKENIRLLNTGCIGDGPRAYIGHPGTAAKAYTIIEVPAGSPEKFTYKTFKPAVNMEIDIKTLPDSIIGFNGVVKREDK